MATSIYICIISIISVWPLRCFIIITYYNNIIYSCFRTGTIAWILIFSRIISFSICFWWTFIIIISIKMLDYFLAIIWVIFWNIYSIAFNTISLKVIIILFINIFYWRRCLYISTIIIWNIIISFIRITLIILWRYSIDFTLNIFICIIPIIGNIFRRRFLFIIISLIIIIINNLILRCFFNFYIK